MMLALLLIGIAFPIACASKQLSLICSPQNLSPTLLEALAAIPPSSFQQYLLRDDSIHEQQWQDQSNSWFAFRPSFLSFISNQKFSVRFDAEPKLGLSFMDVQLATVPPQWWATVCSLTFIRSLPFAKQYCACDVPPNVDGGNNAEVNVTSFCTFRPVCTSRDMVNGFCEVPMDSSGRSCLLISHLSEDDAVERIKNIWTYESQVPTLKTILPKRWTSIYYHENERIAKEYVSHILDFIPYYLFNCVVGFAILLYMQDLMENTLFVLIIQFFVSVFCAIIALIWILQRFGTRLFGVLPQGILQIPTLVGSIVFMYRHPNMAITIRELIYDFWNDGILGYPWMGKAYFCGCFAVVLGLCKYFAGIGLLFLSQGTSNSEGVVLLLFLGISLEYFSELIAYLALLCEAHRLDRSGLGSSKKVTQQQLNVIVEQSTQKALVQLKEYLQSNPEEARKYGDLLRESGKSVEDELLQRFVNSSYAGRPQCSSGKKQQQWWSSYQPLFIGSAIAILLALSAVWVLGRKPSL